MKIQILTIGKIQQKQYQELCEDYLKRCRGRLTIELVHCKNYKEMEKRVENCDWLVGLDENGKRFTSIQFAQWLRSCINKGVGKIIVCLGAAEGLGEQVRKKSDELISLSPFTLNHQLALLLFSEQLYRGLAILNSEPYHKA